MFHKLWGIFLRFSMKVRHKVLLNRGFIFVNDKVKLTYISMILLTVFAVLIVKFLLILALAVFDHQFVF